MKQIELYKQQLPQSVSEYERVLIDTRKSLHDDVNGLDSYLAELKVLEVRTEGLKEYHYVTQREIFQVEDRIYVLKPKMSQEESSKKANEHQYSPCDEMAHGDTMTDKERKQRSRDLKIYGKDSSLTEQDRARILQVSEQTKTDPKKLARRELNLKVKQQRLAEIRTAEVSNYTISNCAVEDLPSKVAANTVDVVFADPPYETAALDNGLYARLSEFCAHALKETGVLVCYSGTIHFDEVLRQLCSKLSFYAIINLTLRRKGNVRGYHVGIKHKPVVICVPESVVTYTKYRLDVGLPQIKTIMEAEPELASRSTHKWEQDIATAEKVLQYFACPEHTLIDPFAGTGTFLRAAQLVKCQSIAGYDIDDTYCTKEALNG